MAHPELIAQLAAQANIPPLPVMAKHPQVPATDPLEERILAAVIEDDLRRPIKEVSGKEGERLYRMMDELNASAARLLPEGTKLPPKPKIYSYDGDQYDMNSTINRKGSAMAFFGSEKFLGELSDKEAKAMMAHELAHRIIDKNPEMQDKLLPPVTEAVRRDLEKQHIPNDPNDPRYKDYMNELATDILAARLTGDPKAYAELIKKYDRKEHEIIEKMVKENIKKEEEKAGHSLTKEEKEKVRQDTLDKTVHPSADMRAEAVQADAKQHEKPHEKAKPNVPQR